MTTSAPKSLFSLLPIFCSLAIAQTAQDSSRQGNQLDQTKVLEELRKRIVGSENKPAEEVFKNIQTMKGMPAARLLRVMEMGYAKSLGVSCEHCHVTNKWESDDVPTKAVAREMSQLVQTINSDLLAKIKNLKSEKPTVNCTTCHRGQTKPASSLP
jgi:hypothetical protein